MLLSLKCHFKKTKLLQGLHVPANILSSLPLQDRRWMHSPLPATFPGLPLSCYLGPSDHLFMMKGNQIFIQSTCIMEVEISTDMDTVLLMEFRFLFIFNISVCPCFPQLYCPLSQTQFIQSQFLHSGYPRIGRSDFLIEPKIRQAEQ